MPNIWHIWHTKHKNKPSSAFLNLKKFGTCLQYCLKYETIGTTMPYTVWLYLIRFFSLLHHLSLSVSPSTTHLSLSLSFWHSRRAVSPRRLAKPSRHTDLTTPRDRDRPGSPLITDPHCDKEELQCEGHGGRKWKLPSATATETVVLIWLSLLKGNKHWRRKEKKNVSMYVRFNL